MIDPKYMSGHKWANPFFQRVIENNLNICYIISCPYDKDFDNSNDYTSFKWGFLEKNIDPEDIYKITKYFNKIDEKKDFKILFEEVLCLDEKDLKSLIILNKIAK